MSRVILLDDIPQARNLEALKTTEKTVYVASSRAGLAAYRESSKTNPGALCVWAETPETVGLFRDEPGAQFLFPYGSLAPSSIAALGSFQGPVDIDLPDARIEDPRLLTPHLEVLQSATRPTPDFSVIIPAFDDEERAKKCLVSWLAASAGAEVILVDDGGNRRWIDSLIGFFPERLTILALSRSCERKRGDHQFRAGIARNAGFSRARGEKIVFCDSDILVPRDILRKIGAALDRSDLVMPQRWQLSEAASRAINEYAGVRFDRDVILSPGAYWETFQTRGLWAEEETPWRWVSTFCLATHRAHLERLGAFRRTFVTYGFEDTELGYRFFKAGLKFELLPVETYHLFQPDSRSEYANDPRRKARLLRISAERFFRHHPGKDVYAALRDWLD